MWDSVQIESLKAHDLHVIIHGNHIRIFSIDGYTQAEYVIPVSNNIDESGMIAQIVLFQENKYLQLCFDVSVQIHLRYYKETRLYIQDRTCKLTGIPGVCRGRNEKGPR